MRDFLSRYSFKAVKLYVTQFAIGLFGAVLAMATSTNNILLIATGVLSAVFYLFLVYITTWEIGAGDRISIDIGKRKQMPWLGFVISLVANLPNFIVATVYTVCWFISHGAEGVATNIAGAMRIATLFSEGMYYGLMTAISFGTRLALDGSGSVVPNELFNFWWAYFIIIIPAVAVGGTAYILGTKNLKLTKLMDPVYPSSDSEPK